MNEKQAKRARKRGQRRDKQNTYRHVDAVMSPIVYRMLHRAYEGDPLAIELLFGRYRVLV